MHFLVGHNQPGYLPNSPDDAAELTSFRDALLALLGDLQSYFEPDEDEQADNLIYELEELNAAVFDDNGEIDRAKWATCVFADPFRALFDGNADQVVFNTGTEVFWIFQA